MAPLPGPLPSSFSVAVHAKRRACVLDAQVALSPFGLLLAQRLAAEFDLWLVRELWQILDNTQSYLSRPDRLLAIPPGEAAGAGEAAGGASLRDTLRQWDLARTITDLTGLRIYWVGDAVCESLLPAGADPDLVTRFETLASSLDARVRGRARDQDSILVDCFRDAAALAASLVPYRPFILTCLARAGPGGAGRRQPALCWHLREWGIESTLVGASRGTNVEREALLSVLARAGAGELQWTGLDLAAVHVLVPRAIVMPGAGGGHGELYPELAAPDEAEVQAADWWQGARGFWYPLTPD